MNDGVLIDTSIWSFALRRHRHQLSTAELAVVEEWRSLVRRHKGILIGPVRQEVLSGIREQSQFDRLRTRLRAFRDAPIDTEDYETAAAFANVCRSSGITGTSIDMLICAVARRLGATVFTTDRDFERYAACLPVRLHPLTRA